MQFLLRHKLLHLIFRCFKILLSTCCFQVKSFSLICKMLYYNELFFGKVGYGVATYSLRAPITVRVLTSLCTHALTRKRQQHRRTLGWEPSHLHVTCHVRYTPAGGHGKPTSLGILHLFNAISFSCGSACSDGLELTLTRLYIEPESINGGSL